MRFILPRLSPGALFTKPSHFRDFEKNLYEIARNDGKDEWVWGYCDLQCGSVMIFYGGCPVLKLNISDSFNGKGFR